MPKSNTPDRAREIDILRLVNLPEGTLLAICGQCGQVRTVKAGAVRSADELELKCLICKARTMHYPVKNPADDWRENINQKAQPRTTRYDPLVDLTERWPGWRLECKPLAGWGEVVAPDEKLIELDSEYFDDDWELALAHAIAHLDLHLELLPESFSNQQCWDADFLAEVRLDREEDRE